MKDYVDLRVALHCLSKTNSMSLYKREVCKDAADAIEALQAEIAEKDKSFEEMKPAVERLERVFEAMCGVVCSYCVNAQCYVRGGTKDCSPLLRGGPAKEQLDHEIGGKVLRVPNWSSCEGGEKEY